MSLVERTGEAVAVADGVPAAGPLLPGVPRTGGPTDGGGRRRRLLPDPASPQATVLLALVLAGLLHLIWWRFLATSGGDIAAQDAWAEFAREYPGSAYNLAWYGGMHPVSYSVASPYLMALLGVRTTMIVSGTLAAGVLAWLVAYRVEPGWRRTAPVLAAVVALFGNAVSGRVTFALGTLFALVALSAVVAWPESWPRSRLLRGMIAALAAGLATAGSPVAGLFLGIVAAALWLQRRRPAAYALGVPPVLVVVVSSVVFPFSGRQPMTWNSAILPCVAGLAVVLLAPRAWRLSRLGAALYVLAVVLAWLIPSPVGTNIGRLGLLFGGVVLVAVLLDPRRDTSFASRTLGPRVARVLLVLALITNGSWQLGTALRDALTSRPPASFTTDLEPLLVQLRTRGAGLGRVEMVPTRSHREASAIAPYLPLARGWNRQADAERNPIFYRDRPLTAGAYERWLHRWAVRFVVVAAAEPDPAAREEAALIDTGLPYLERVWGNADWDLYAVEDPTPLVSRPARVLSFDAGGLVLSTPKAGRILVRIAASPWLTLVDADGDALPRLDDDTPLPTGGVDLRAIPGLLPGVDADRISAPEPLTVDPGSLSCLAGLSAERPRQVERGKRFDFVVLHAAAPGTYRIAAPYSLPRGSTCPDDDAGAAGGDAAGAP
ncbi:MFS transporter [Nocardioides fonticola]|uniref:MFS transporter n=1 Tax=Nocardioides fonticola TaxID=450363 RepID=A0ABP7X9T4_9ACTN